MKREKQIDTVRLSKTMFCRACGWAVVHACCNDEFRSYKDASEWDWWYYCSNKGCKNHDGEGVFQNDPDWCFVVNKEIHNETSMGNKRR